MMQKLKSLLEGYAWERKADGSLPTIDETTAMHAEKQDLDEKAESVAQRKAAAIALQVKRGEMSHDDLKAHGAAMDMLDMSEKELEKIAKTKEKSLPYHKK